MNNAIIYLLGHYGVGKLTVAKALCAATGARLLDNHLINNVVFGLISADGKTPLPRGIWEATERIRDVAFDVIERFAPPEFSYVLTNALQEDPMDRRWFERAELLAIRRGARFAPIVLSCEEGENMRRVGRPDRQANMKHTDVGSALERRRTIPLLSVAHPNRLDLDTTTEPPERTAAAIIAHMQRLPQ
jgi:hypothetical protein